MGTVKWLQPTPIFLTLVATTSPLGQNSVFQTLCTGLVAHADDIPCIFKNDGVFLGPPSEEQAKTIKAMVHEWTTFAKSLKPSESSWKSGGSLMVFQQPESGVLTKEQTEKAPFQDFADRMELLDALYWQKKKEELPVLSKKNLLKALSQWDRRQ